MLIYNVFHIILKKNQFFYQRKPFEYEVKHKTLNKSISLHLREKSIYTSFNYFSSENLHKKFHGPPCSRFVTIIDLVTGTAPKVVFLSNACVSVSCRRLLTLSRDPTRDDLMRPSVYYRLISE